MEIIHCPQIRIYNCNGRTPYIPSPSCGQLLFIVKLLIYNVVWFCKSKTVLRILNIYLNLEHWLRFETRSLADEEPLCRRVVAGHGRPCDVVRLAWRSDHDTLISAGVLLMFTMFIPTLLLHPFHFLLHPSTLQWKTNSLYDVVFICGLSVRKSKD